MARTKATQRQDPRRDVLRKFGEHVRALRHERGLTQELLATELSMSVAYLSLIERGRRNPPFTTVVAIADALGVSARELAAD